MAPDSKKSPKSPSSGSSSKPAQKPTSTVGSVLASAFFKDSSEVPKTKTLKPSETKEHPKKDSSSKYASKSTKPPRTTSTRTEPLSSTYFKDESRIIKPMPSERDKEHRSPPHISKDWQPSQLAASSQPTPQPPKDWKPSKTVTPKPKSNHTTDRAKKMAKKQLKREKLSSKEVEEQDVWAQEQLMKSGCCPKGWGWVRYTAPAGYEKYSGYRCGLSPPELNAFHVHMITDELLAEGKCGYYQLSRETNWWTGPWYPSDSPPGGGFQIQIGAPVINLAPGTQPNTIQPGPNQLSDSVGSGETAPYDNSNCTNGFISTEASNDSLTLTNDIHEPTNDVLLKHPEAW
ncbi:hypothetical protein BKA65DRAFT_585523 [Rhexocercosporidium sp. MPI-PUGE-AT-0058]|nr:hypothetical protein BKA65DRAFT_585523 [Rhexocercosporidium sp. MPI-PUGE-AT-0058]